MVVRLLLLLAGAALLLAGCGGSARDTTSQPRADAGEPSGTLRIYSTVTQATVDAVIDAYTAQHPDVDVELFRAPTGELNARVAGEQRDGEVQADVFWLTDPLSMQQFAAQGILAEWSPDTADVLAPEYRSPTFWGTRLLNLVIVHSDNLAPVPQTWHDLADPAYADAVAIPDPGFAGSAFGALAYFAQEADGFDFYRALADNGAVQVQAPGEVTTGVAEGRFAAGITLDHSARGAAEDGSPVDLVAPEPGAIAIYSPIGVLETADNRVAAESFTEFTLTEQAQAAIADSGWQPIRDDVDWPHELPLVAPDWSQAYDQQNALLEEYRTIFEQ